LEKLIFVRENWPSDHKVSCKSPFSLIKFIDMDGDLKEKLEKFNCSFELDEVVDM
jgi:hypothetical protein